MYKVIKRSKMSPNYNVELFKGSHNECFTFILQHQGQSVDYAMKYEGYAIELIVTSCSNCNIGLTEKETYQPIPEYVDNFLCIDCYSKEGVNNEI